MLGNLAKRLRSLFDGEATDAPKEADPAPTPSPADGLQPGADRVRNAAKWLLATFGAVAAVLVAGLQFSAIGSVPAGWRTWAAIGGSALAIVGVVLLIGLVFQVMRPSTVSIDELAAGKAGKPLAKYVGRNMSLLQGYASVKALADDYQAALDDVKLANDEYHAAMRATGTTEGPKLAAPKAKLDVAQARLDYLDGQLGYITKYLSVEKLRGRLSGRRQFYGLCAALAIGVGVGAYAWGTNAPKSETAATSVVLRGARLPGVNLTRATLAHADLTGAVLARAIMTGADLSGANLTDANLRGAKLKGAKLDKVTWKNTTCPDGTNSDVSGTCKGHL
jgi:pentapeptide repeat protein